MSSGGVIFFVVGLLAAVGGAQLEVFGPLFFVGILLALGGRRERR